MIRVVLPILLLCITFVVDYGAYRGLHAPKQYLFLVLVPAAALGMWRWMQQERQHAVLHISIIEILLLVRLFWIGGTYPSVAGHPSDVGFWPLAALLILVVVARQVGEYDRQQGNKASLLLFFLRALWLSAVAQALLGGMQLFWAPSLPAGLIKTPMIGTIGAANGFGLWMALGTIAATTDALCSNKRFIRLSALSATGVMLPVLVLNGSRGAGMALLCAGAGVGMCYLFNQSKHPVQNDNNKTEWYIASLRNVMARRPLLLSTAIGVVLLSVGIGAYLSNIASSEGRLMVWAISMPMVGDHPLTGVGHGRYGVHYLDYQATYFAEAEHQAWQHKATTLKQAHNEFLHAFCETGIPGGLLFLFVWGYALWRLVRYLAGGLSRVSTLYYGMAALLIAVLVHALVDAPLHVLPISIVAYAVLGFIPAPSIKVPLAGGRLIRYVATLVLIALFGVALWTSVHAYPAFRLWQRGLQQAQRGDTAEAIRTYRQALERLPENGELQFHLGSTMAQAGTYSRGLYFMREAQRTFADRNLLLSMGYAYLQLGKIRQAEQMADQAARAFPDHLAPHLLLGEIYYKQDRIEASKAALRKCIERRTRVQSADVAQLARKAQRLWDELYRYGWSMP